MKFLKATFFLISGLSASLFAEESSQAASVFVQDPTIFHRRQAELQKMQAEAKSPNEGLEALLADADKIAKMNDQCATISLNEVMDESCWHFYQVELPAFEEKFMRVTGEVQLGYVETVRGIEDRKLQIEACADALTDFISSKEEYVNLEGGVFLEPLEQGFDANYNFTFQYAPERRQHLMEIAKVWGETCKDIVVRQDGVNFAPYFVGQLDRLNQGLLNRGSLAVIKLDSSASPTIYIDIAKPIRSAYYLNGIKLFHSRIGSNDAANSNLRITFTKDGVIAGGEKAVNKKDGSPLQFSGTLQFKDNTTKISGRFFWENSGNTEGVDFGPDYDEDSLAVAKAKAIQEQQVAEEKLAEERKAAKKENGGLHFSFWAGLTNDIINYTDSSVCERFLGLENTGTKQSAYSCNNKANGKRSYAFYMPDIGATARIGYNFGPAAEFSVTAGLGATFGLAFGPEKSELKGIFKRSYGGILGQVELGYKNFGIRETIVFPINVDDGPNWYQFRTGAFYSLGFINAELGYTFIKHAGSGAHIGIGTTF